MADLTYEERQDIEEYLAMGGGYVLDFYNSTFRDFIHSNIKIDIYSGKYSQKGLSKANHLREFFRIESNYLVGRLLNCFVNYYRRGRLKNSQEFQKEKDFDIIIEKIASRLSEESISNQIDKITPTNNDNDFKILADSIKKSIEDNQPELALDRLHTFYTKYVRELCSKNSIDFTETESLNAIFGKFVKFVENEIGFESEITKTILKYSISILDKYNDVRNNKSFAHDNKLLNYNESLYVFDTLARLKGFIDKIQENIDIKNEEMNRHEVTDIDLPF